MAEATLTWTHETTGPLGSVVNAAVDRAIARRGLDVAGYRALTLAVFGAAADLGPEPVKLGAHDASVSVAPSADRIRLAWQNALLTGHVALTAWEAEVTAPVMEAFISGVSRVRDFNRRNVLTTRDGAEAVSGTAETGVLWGAVAVVVVRVVAQGLIAAVAAYGIAVGGEAIAHRITADAKTSQLAATLAETSRVVDAHVERERAAGKPIPWSDPEWSRLQALYDTTRNLTGWQPPAMNTVPNLKKLAESAGEAISGAGSGFGVALALGLLYFLAKD